eukprot:3471471-Amphidinium_carterae.1
MPQFIQSAIVAEGWNFSFCSTPLTPQELCDVTPARVEATCKQLPFGCTDPSLPVSVFGQVSAVRERSLVSLFLSVSRRLKLSPFP